MSRLPATRIIRRLERHSYGTDRYEVRCGCGRIIIRSAMAVRGGDGVPPIMCGRCCARDDAAPSVASVDSDELGGGAA